MRHSGRRWSAVLLLSRVAIALCIGSCASSDARAQSALNPGQPALSGRYIDVSDPPPAMIPRELDDKTTRFLDDATECPSFLFQNGFESGRLFQDGIFRHGFDSGIVSGTRIRYTTAAGLVVQVDKYTISIQDALGMNSVQHWGDPHENLNGKHIKDWGGLPEWDGARRTTLLDGGAKVTMQANAPAAVVLLTSIYDGQQNVQIDNSTNTILHHSADPVDTSVREAAQYDGETARFTTDPATAVALYDTVYNEDANFNVVSSTVPLGSTGGCANPNQVNDYFP